MTPAAAAVGTALPAAAVFASFGVYALIRSRRPLDRDAVAKGGQRFLGLYLRDYWYWLHGPAERAALKSGWSPDTFTLIGLAVTFAAGLAFAAGWFAIGGWLIVLGGAFDILDGRVARARGMQRPAGAFLDSALDRYGDWALFSGLAAYFGSGFGLWAALFSMGGSFCVSYARARAESLGLACSDGWLQRGERFFFLASAGILTPVAWFAGLSYPALILGALALIAVFANVTAVMRIRSVYSALSERQQAAS